MTLKRSAVCEPTWNEAMHRRMLSPLRYDTSIGIRTSLSRQAILRPEYHCGITIDLMTRV